jgi:hypothetical protein
MAHRPASQFAACPLVRRRNMSQFRPVWTMPGNSEDSVFAQFRGPARPLIEHVGKVQVGCPLSARSVEGWGRSWSAHNAVSAVPRIRARVAWAGQGPPDVDPLEEDSLGEREVTGDWWLGLITGFGICLILWWFVDRHRRYTMSHPDGLEMCAAGLSRLWGARRR